MRTTDSFVYTELRVAPIFPVSPDTGSIITPTLITADALSIRNNATISGNATVSTNLTVDGIATLATATIGNITGNVAMEGNIVFPYNTIGGIVLPPNEQWLYDIQNVRNITCGSLTVVGGATGDEFFPPLHYASEVTIGNDGGLTSQGVVVINGQLPDPAEPGTNLTNALTVRGDMVVDFGVLTTYNGLVCLPFNLDANALEVDGITFLNGATNIVGSTTIEGTAGILGNTTITGAVEVTGGCLFTGGLAQQAGDWTLGNFGTEYTGIINTATTINGSLNMADFNINNVGTLTATNINATNFTTSNIFTSNARIPNFSTNTVVVYQDLSGEDIVGGISFSDISNNLIAGIGLSSSGPYPLGIFSLNSIITYAVGGSIITDAGALMELTAQENATLTGLSNVTIQTAGNATVVGATAVVRGITGAVDIVSDDAGIALEAETGIFMNDNYGASLNVALSNIEGIATNGDISFTSGNSISLSAISSINLSSITTANSLLVNNITNSGTDIALQTYNGNLNLGTAVNVIDALDINIVGNRNINIFGGNRNGGGTFYSGTIKLLTGFDIEMRTYNGGAIYIDTTTPPYDVVDTNRNIFITAGYNVNLSAGTGYDILCGSKLNLSNNNISNVNKMYYGATRQPFIQFGSNTTGATGTTVTLPVPYANATYAVQLTYIGNPAGNQTLYLISQTTSNFRFHGHNNSPAYWTTFGFNN